VCVCVECKCICMRMQCEWTGTLNKVAYCSLKQQHSWQQQQRRLRQRKNCFHFCCWCLLLLVLLLRIDCENKMRCNELKKGCRLCKGWSGKMGGEFILHRLRVAIFLKALLSGFFCCLRQLLPSLLLLLLLLLLFSFGPNVLLTLWGIKLAALDNNLYLICDKSMQNSV